MMTTRVGRCDSAMGVIVDGGKRSILVDAVATHCTKLARSDHTMKNVLVLYATREGQTEKVATRIATHLQHLGNEVLLVNAGDSAATRKLDPSTFDLLVFGASMHAGGLERELIAYIGRHRETIEAHARSIFLVLLSAAAKDPQLRERWLADARSKLHEQTPVRFDDAELIAGALAYSKYSWPMKWIMQRIARQAGEGTDVSRDYEYTDWQQVERYARRLSAA